MIFYFVCMKCSFSWKCFACLNISYIDNSTVLCPTPSHSTPSTPPHLTSLHPTSTPTPFHIPLPHLSPPHSTQPYLSPISTHPTLPLYPTPPHPAYNIHKNWSMLQVEKRTNQGIPDYQLRLACISAGTRRLLKRDKMSGCERVWAGVSWYKPLCLDVWHLIWLGCLPVPKGGAGREALTLGQARGGPGDDAC